MNGSKLIGTISGQLVLKTFTAVIKVLYGRCSLAKSCLGDSNARIALIPGTISWDAVRDDLLEFAKSLNVTVPPTEAGQVLLEDVLYALAIHYGAEDDYELATLIQYHPLSGDVDLDALFTIARAFDDGHGLSAYKIDLNKVGFVH